MLLKPAQQLIVDFLQTRIAAGEGYVSCLKNYAADRHLTKATFNRRWKVAGEQFLAAQIEHKKKLAAFEVKAAIDTRKKEIMTADERREYLTRIISGEEKITMRRAVWNADTKKMQLVPVENPADEMTRIRAIAELNKMGGDYAAAKVEVTQDNRQQINLAVLNIETLDKLLLNITDAPSGL